MLSDLVSGSAWVFVLPFSWTGSIAADLVFAALETCLLISWISSSVNSGGGGGNTSLLDFVFFEPVLEDWVVSILSSVSLGWVWLSTLSCLVSGVVLFVGLIEVVLFKISFTKLSKITDSSSKVAIYLFKLFSLSKLTGVPFCCFKILLPIVGILVIGVLYVLVPSIGKLVLLAFNKPANLAFEMLENKLIALMLYHEFQENYLKLINPLS